MPAKINKQPTFEEVDLEFTLDDVGSEIIDQLSSDVYSGPGSIMRELVKNAYDSYLHLDVDVLDDESFQRTIIIRAERGEDGVGRITIADNGIGLTAEGLKEFVQISKSKKSVELDYATGFRGLGSWAILGSGSKVIISSRRKGHAVEAQLEIDVRKIYEQMGPHTSLDGILNNRECIRFSERPLVPKVGNAVAASMPV